MSRVAIIIESSNVAGESDLPGARVDQKNWINFLKSNLGGAWEDREIRSLSKPSSLILTNLLYEHRNQYCFVAFSGHGCDGAIVLNENCKNYRINELKPRGTKGTMIVDSCRGVEAAKEFNFSAGNILAESVQGSRTDVANSRSDQLTKYSAQNSQEQMKMLEHAKNLRSSHSVKWHLAQILSNPGIVEMYACSQGQTAGENAKAGGLYTSLLLSSATLWKNSGGLGKIHTTRNAHDYAFSKLPPQQRPVYSPSNIAFPFAVSL